MRNEVTVSGLISGEIEAIKNEGVIFTVSNIDKNGSTKDYLVVAHSELAKLLTAKAKSGQRIAFAGRQSSEELIPGSKIYHAVLQASKLLALGGEEGTPYAQGTLQGFASCDSIKVTKNGSGTQVASLNVRTERVFSKDGVDRTFTSYHTVTLWGEKAQAIESMLPMSDVFITAFGQLMPGDFESKKHDGAIIKKIEIWADEITIGGDLSAQSAPAPAPSRAPAVAPRAAAPKATKTSDSDLPF